MAKILEPKRKSFPLWFQDETKNANYSSEYERCLDNLPISSQVNTFTTITGVTSGTDKYWGGVLAPNGSIYCAPHQATTILKINTLNDTISTFGSFVGSYKYGGGILAPNGKIYFIPCSATAVLVVDPSNDSSYTFGSIAGGSFYWLGGSLNKEGTKIYCTPHLTTSILVIDIENESTYTIPGLPATANKYSSSQLTPDGYIYCVPTHISNILKIDPSNDTFTTFGTASGGSDKYYSSILAPDGFIYGLPYAGTNDVLKINTSNDTISQISSSGGVLGACLGVDGKIYGISTGSFNVFDPSNNSTNVVNGLGLSYNQGLVMGLNGKMYSIPRYSDGVIVIGQTIENLNSNFPLSRFNNKL